MIQKCNSGFFTSLVFTSTDAKIKIIRLSACILYKYRYGPRSKMVITHKCQPYGWSRVTVTAYVSLLFVFKFKDCSKRVYIWTVPQEDCSPKRPSHDFFFKTSPHTAPNLWCAFFLYTNLIQMKSKALDTMEQNKLVLNFDNKGNGNP